MPNFQVIILGAGINGVCIADSLAKQGYSVLVLEKGTIGCGTSSKSSRLIHGGLRYLENPLQWPLVRESLLARQELLTRFPNLVQLTPFYLPIYENSPRPSWLIRFGLLLYDLLSGRKNPSKRVLMEEFSTTYPQVSTQDIKAIFSYYDGKANDLDLTKAIAAEARAKGVTISENSHILAIDTESTPDICITTKDITYKTKVLINATGPWINEVNKSHNLPAKYIIRKVSGIHIRIKQQIPSPLFLQATFPRVFFMIPEGKSTLIGTTERVERTNIDDIRVHAKDVAYLIEQANRYLKEPITSKDIIEEFIGVRPLVESKADSTRISRESKIGVHNLGDNNTLVQVFGGKLTTAVSLGRKVASIVASL